MDYVHLAATANMLDGGLKVDGKDKDGKFRAASKPCRGFHAFYKLVSGEVSRRAKLRPRLSEVADDQNNETLEKVVEEEMDAHELEEHFERHTEALDAVSKYYETNAPSLPLAAHIGFASMLNECLMDILTFVNSMPSRADAQSYVLRTVRGEVMKLLPSTVDDALASVASLCDSAAFNGLLAAGTSHWVGSIKKLIVLRQDAGGLLQLVRRTRLQLFFHACCHFGTMQFVSKGTDGNISKLRYFSKYFAHFMTCMKARTSGSTLILVPIRL